MPTRLPICFSDDESCFKMRAAIGRVDRKAIKSTAYEAYDLFNKKLT